MALSRTVPSVKTVAPVYITTDMQGVAVEHMNGELGRTDSGSTDDVRKNNGLESVKARTDGSGLSLSGVNPLPQLQPVTTSVASFGVDISSSEGTSSESSFAEKIERLRRMIDRAAGQLYTIAEVYLMMMKPSRVPLEYDWVDTSASSVAADDVSGKLQKLVSIAKAAFTASTAKPLVSVNSNVDSYSHNDVQDLLFLCAEILVYPYAVSRLVNARRE